MARIKTTNIRDNLRLIEGFRSYDRDSQTSSPGQNGQVFAKQNGVPAWIDAPPTIGQRYLATNGIGIQEMTGTGNNPNNVADCDQTLITSGTSDFNVRNTGIIDVLNDGIYIISYSLTIKHNLAGNPSEGSQDENMIIGQAGIELNNSNIIETVGRGTPYANTGNEIYNNGFLTLSGDTVVEVSAGQNIRLVGGIRNRETEASVVLAYLDFSGICMYTVI